MVELMPIFPGWALVHDPFRVDEGEDAHSASETVLMAGTAIGRGSVF